jgi:phosphoadenosine phosphosulfate reductase
MSTVTDKVIVGFSGGKDSIVTMDMCFKYFPHVQPFFMYLVPGLEFQERTLRWYENKYNTEIMRIPHFETSDFYKYGTFRPYDMDVPIVSINDCYQYVRNETGYDWIAAGERISDSIVRRAMIKQSGSIDQNRGRMYPVANWNKQQVLKYVKRKKLLLPQDSRVLGFSFSSLWGKELIEIKRHFPEDYEKILHYFPFAGAGVERFELYGK